MVTKLYVLGRTISIRVKGFLFLRYPLQLQGVVPVISIHLARCIAHLSGNRSEGTGEIDMVCEPCTQETYRASNDHILLVVPLMKPQLLRRTRQTEPNAHSLLIV